MIQIAEKFDHQRKLMSSVTFVLPYKMVLPFEPVCVTLKCNHSKLGKASVYVLLFSLPVNAVWFKVTI